MGKACYRTWRALSTQQMVPGCELPSTYARECESEDQDSSPVCKPLFPAWGHNHETEDGSDNLSGFLWILSPLHWTSPPALLWRHLPVPHHPLPIPTPTGPILAEGLGSPSKREQSCLQDLTMLGWF